MNNIFKKRLKRKRILKGRIECHGSKLTCQMQHHGYKNKIEKPSFKENKYTDATAVSGSGVKYIPEEPKKKSWLKKLFGK